MGSVNEIRRPTARREAACPASLIMAGSWDEYRSLEPLDGRRGQSQAEDIRP